MKYLWKRRNEEFPLEKMESDHIIDALLSLERKKIENINLVGTKNEPISIALKDNKGNKYQISQAADIMKKILKARIKKIETEKNLLHKEIIEKNSSIELISAEDTAKLLINNDLFELKLNKIKKEHNDLIVKAKIVSTLISECIKQLSNLQLD